MERGSQSAEPGRHTESPAESRRQTRGRGQSGGKQTRHSSLETLGPRLLPGRSGVAAAVARRVAVRDVADDDTRARREAREQPP